MTDEWQLSKFSSSN